MSSHKLIQAPKWRELAKQAPPVNKEVACYNPTCGCKGHGYMSEHTNEMVQILQNPTPKGDYFQDFKWKVTHWCHLVDLPEGYDA